MLVHPVYKCALCGRLTAAHTANDVPHDALPDLCGKVIRSQYYANNPALCQVPMYVICNCDDGSCGVAQFAGFKRAK